MISLPDALPVHCPSGPRYVLSSFNLRSAPCSSAWLTLLNGLDLLGWLGWLSLLGWVGLLGLLGWLGWVGLLGLLGWLGWVGFLGLPGWLGWLGVPSWFGGPGRFGLGRCDLGGWVGLRGAIR